MYTKAYSNAKPLTDVLHSLVTGTLTQLTLVLQVDTLIIISSGEGAFI